MSVYSKQEVALMLGRVAGA